jgi:hypothetical protein
LIFKKYLNAWWRYNEELDQQFEVFFLLKILREIEKMVQIQTSVQQLDYIDMAWYSMARTLK